MQTATFNIFKKTPLQLWRALPAEITISGINDITGDWVFLLDKDWVDGAIITGVVTKDNNNIIVTIDMLDNNYIASAISGKPVLECKGTLTDGQNQCYLIPINIQNRTVNTAPAPTPATSYYTKAQTDTLLAGKADESELSDYLLKTGGKISSLILSNSSDTSLFSFQDGTNNGILFSQSYVNSNITISTTLFRVRNSTVTISAAGGLNLQSSINEINYNNHAQNTAGGLCVLDSNGSLAIPGNITTAGKENITLNSLTAFAPNDNKIYIYNLSADSTLTFDTTTLTNTAVDFELQIVQGATPFNVTWPNGIKWGDSDGKFSASNDEPDINTANTIFGFTGRLIGNRILMNLAYTEEV